MSETKESKYLALLGKRVAEVRRKHNLTQEDLAEKAGLTQLAVSFIEQGRRWPRLTTILKLAKALNSTVSELFKDF
jgi:transcriptional regulator with XRE-family HTH domain